MKTHKNALKLVKSPLTVNKKTIVNLYFASQAADLLLADLEKAFKKVPCNPYKDLFRETRAFLSHAIKLAEKTSGRETRV